MRIEGTVAVVTGAASGLGAATAARLVQRGSHVVAMDLDEGRLQFAFGSNPNVTCLAGDLCSTDDIAASLAVARERGDLRVAINCAGNGLPPQRTVARDGTVQALEPWRAVVELNLVAAFDFTRQVAQVMAQLPEAGEAGRGVIVHTSSIAGLDGSLGVSAYASSKAALTALVQSTAKDLSVWGIRVFAIAPGAIDTPAFRLLPPELQLERAKQCVYPRRPGRADEFAFLVEHVVQNDYLNADCIRFDAGLRIPR